MDMSASINEIHAADEARYQALYAQDIERLSDMLHKDYRHTHANGNTEDKASFLATIAAARYRFVRADRAEQFVRVMGSTAILNGITHTTIETADGQKTLRNVFVTVWVKDRDGWKMLHWQATPLN